MDTLDIETEMRRRIKEHLARAKNSGPSGRSREGLRAQTLSNLLGWIKWMDGRGPRP